jgi:hypothetical protein
MAITTRAVCNYLERYIEEYRKEFSRFVTPAPQGGGYPALEISPYLISRKIQCWVTQDGTVIYDESREPDNSWWMAGGPAFVVDVEPSLIPPEVIDLLKRKGLYGKNIGRYRIVAKQGVPAEIWKGELGDATEEVEARVMDSLIIVKRMPLDLAAFLQRFTFGAFQLILNLPLRRPDESFWTPFIVRGLGICTADLKHHRFLNYLEVSPHLEEAAWDTRGIYMRVQTDVRRDFAQAFTALQAGSQGLISMGGESVWIKPFFDRLSILSKTLDKFAALLCEAGDAKESIFHDFLRAHSIILDVYADAISRPRFEYPNGERSPLGKEFVEPDFLLRYSNGSYKLVELERPSKPIATKQGQPRSEFTQAAFQIAEFRDFISKHYSRIKDEFPGICAGTGAMIILSRNTEKSFGGRQNIQEYKTLLRADRPDIEVLTYDDLLDRARYAYSQLATLIVPR